MVHFNWTQLIPGVAEHNLIHVATAAITAGFLIGMGLLARLSLGSGEKAVAPAGKFSLKGIFELVTEFHVSLCDMVIGENGRKFTPLFTTIFVYILINNLMGLIPGMTPATDNRNMTFALGMFSFLMYNHYGFKEHGIGYLKQLLGPIIWLAPLMFIVELISHLVRPLSLGLRLWGNMMGDHTVLGISLDLVPFWLPIPVVFYCLGIFVCFMQAFVFTMLSMIYVSMAVSHDH